MATLPSTGSISLSQIYSVFGKTLGPSISLASASTGVYGAIKTTSTFRPDGIAPHAMSEFRGYDHSGIDTVPPSIPTNLRTYYGNDNQNSSVFIRWTASTDNVAVAGYELQKRINTNGRWINEYTGINTSYDDLNAFSGLYFYRVRAFDAAKNYSEYSSIEFFDTSQG